MLRRAEPCCRAVPRPEALADRIRTLQPRDYLLLATDGAITKTLLRTNGVWDIVAQMGGGWLGDRDRHGGDRR